MKRGKEMKIGIIAGSIGAVVILLLLSFNTVFGVQNTGSIQAQVSPLFSTKIKQITNQHERNISSNFLGKTNLDFLIPGRSDTIGGTNKVIQQIQGMSDDAFARLLDYVVQQIHRTNSPIDAKTIVAGLSQIRQNSEVLRNSPMVETRDITLQATPTACWFPGCLVVMCITYIAFIITVLVLITIGFTIAC